MQQVVFVVAVLLANLNVLPPVKMSLKAFFYMYNTFKVDGVLLFPTEAVVHERILDVAAMVSARLTT